jgi:hypothetical protein
MSSKNIKDINFNSVKKEIDELISELYLTNYVLVKKNNVQDPDDNNYIIFKTKYKYLFNTSKTLFNYILSEINKNGFNKVNFDFKINEMLYMIHKIQNSEITQDEASKKVGVMLANQYIPNNIRTPEKY